MNLPAVIRTSRDRRGFETLGGPAEARAAIEELSQAIEPIPAAERLPEAFAAWPHGDGLLVARIRDAGRDSHGRPHTVRIEAGWIVPRPSDDVAASLTQPDSWPETIANEQADVVLTPQADGIVQSPPYFRGDAAAWRFRPTPTPITAAAPTRRRSLRTITVGLAAFALGAAAGGTLADRYAEHRNAEQRKAQAEQFNARCRDYEAQLRSANEDIQRLRQDPLQAIRDRLDRIERTLAPLDSPAAFWRWLAALQSRRPAASTPP